MNGPVEFLEAELTRIEGLARVATPGPWQADAYEEEIQSSAGTVARMRDFVRRMSSVQVEADMQLIVGMADPAAVLRRVASDRQILAEHQPTWSTGEPEYGYHHVAVVGESGRTRYAETRDDEPIPPYWCAGCHAQAPCRTVRLLAEAYGWTEETR